MSPLKIACFDCELTNPTTALCPALSRVLGFKCSYSCPVAPILSKALIARWSALKRSRGQFGGTSTIIRSRRRVANQWLLFALKNWCQVFMRSEVLMHVWCDDFNFSALSGLQFRVTLTGDQVIRLWMFLLMLFIFRFVPWTVIYD